MKYIFTFMLVSLFTLLTLSQVSATEYLGKGWNTALYTTCRLPCALPTPDRQQSVAWLLPAEREKLAITVAPGDVGGCTSDRKPRDGAPYWERAELTSSQVLQDDTRHLISFEAEFAKGFAGKRETFFQIHGWTKTCNSAPLLMMMMDWRNLQAKVLKNTDEDPDGAHVRGDLVQVLTQKPPLTELMNRTNRFDVMFDRTQEPPLMTAILNGKPLFENEPVHMADCAEPRIKIGIYRPGKVNPAVSRLHLGKVITEGAAMAACEAPETDLLSN